MSITNNKKNVKENAAPLGFMNEAFSFFDRAIDKAQKESEQAEQEYYRIANGTIPERKGVGTV